MGWLGFQVTTLVLFAGVAAAAGPRDALVLARKLYNEAKYDDAIVAAKTAAAAPNLAASANVVLARSHLERFRRSADPADLTTARETLARIKPAALKDDDRLDLIVALGESLYLDDKPGAAAEQFELALARADRKQPERREQILDWWASALDRQAQLLVSAPDAKSLENRIISRMEEELRLDEGSMVASYWLVAASRGAGDVERAWSAAIAAWVRAAQAGRRGVSLQTDLNRFVVQAVIPERARLLGSGNPEPSAAAMRREWESLKSAWVAKP